jgi:hypothetical protein
MHPPIMSLHLAPLRQDSLLSPYLPQSRSLVIGHALDLALPRSGQCRIAMLLIDATVPRGFNMVGK